MMKTMDIPKKFDNVKVVRHLTNVIKIMKNDRKSCKTMKHHEKRTKHHGNEGTALDKNKLCSHENGDDYDEK